MAYWLIYCVLAVGFCFSRTAGFSGAASLYSAATGDLLEQGNLYAAELAARQALRAGAEQAPESIAGSFAALGRALALQSIVHRRQASARRSIADLQLLEAAVSLHRALAWTSPDDLRTANELRNRLHALQPLLKSIQAPPGMKGLCLGRSQRGTSPHTACIPDYILQTPPPPCNLEMWLDADASSERDLFHPPSHPPSHPVAEGGVPWDAALPSPADMPPVSASAFIRAAALHERGYRQAAVRLLCVPEHMQVSLSAAGQGENITWATAAPTRAGVLRAVTVLRICGVVSLRNSMLSSDVEALRAANTAVSRPIVAEALSLLRKKQLTQADGGCPLRKTGGVVWAMRSVRRLEYMLPLEGPFVSDGLVANPLLAPILAHCSGVHGLEIDSMSMITTLGGADRQAWHVDAPMTTASGATASLRSRWRRRLLFCYGSADLRGLATRGVQPCKQCPCTTGTRGTRSTGSDRVFRVEPRELQRRETRLLHAAMSHSEHGHFDDTAYSPPPGIVMAVPLVNLTGGAPPTEFVPGSHLECDTQLQATLAGQAPLGFFNRAEAEKSSTNKHDMLGESVLAGIDEVESHGGAAVCPEAHVREPWLAAASAGDVVLFDLRTRHRGGSSSAQAPVRPLVYAAFVQSWWRDSVNFPPPQSKGLGGVLPYKRRALRRLDSRAEIEKHGVGVAPSGGDAAAVGAGGSPVVQEQSSKQASNAGGRGYGRGQPWATLQGYDAETLDDLVLWGGGKNLDEADSAELVLAQEATLRASRVSSGGAGQGAGGGLQQNSEQSAWECALGNKQGCAALDALRVDVVQDGGTFPTDQVLDSFMQQSQQ